LNNSDVVVLHGGSAIVWLVSVATITCAHGRWDVSPLVAQHRQAWACTGKTTLLV